MRCSAPAVSVVGLTSVSGHGLMATHICFSAWQFHYYERACISESLVLDVDLLWRQNKTCSMFLALKA